MAQVVNDLVTKFSFLGSTRPLDEYNVTLGGSIKLLGGMALGLTAGAAAFGFWADSVLGGVDALGALSKESGISVAAIQELSFMAEQTQSTAAAMESTIASLSTTIGSAAQKGSEDFARLGISVRDANGQVKNADTVLGEVSDRFRALGLSINEQKSFAGALGIDSSLLQLMGKTTAEMGAMRERARELGTLTAEQTKQAEEYKKSLNAMWFGVNAVSNLVAVGFAPTLRGLAEDFTDLIADNKEWIVSGVQTSIEWIGNFVAAFKRLMPVMALVGVAFIALKLYALGFGGAMALAFAPVTLVVVGVTALVLIIDDLIVAFKGGQSVIADFFAEFFGIDIVSVMRDVAGVADAMFSAFIGLGASIYDRVFAPMFSLIGDAIAGILPDWALDLIGDNSAAGASIATRNTIPIGASTVPGGSTDNRRIEQSNEINIYTADARAAGAAVSDSLQAQLDNANTQLATGGR